MPTYQEYIPEELNIFSNRAFLNCISESSHKEYSALNTLDGANSLEFNSLAYTDQYKDLSWVFLKLRLQVTKGDGTLFKETDQEQPHLTTNALHSIFKSAFISLNGNNLRNVEQNYHYKEWIETTMNFNIEYANSRLTSQLYIPNSTSDALKKAPKNSKVFELYGRINLINVAKLLIPGVSFNLRLNLESPEFYFVEDIVKTMTTSKLKIDDAKLCIRHVKPSSEVLLAHERLLASGEPAVYEYKRGEIFTQNVAKGASNLNIMNFYSGPRPSLALFGMVKNSSYTGDRKENPFEFKPNDLKSFNFVINGNARPLNPYEFIVDSTHSCYTHLFSKVYESLGFHNSDRSNLITYDNFAKDHFMIVEDLSNFNIGLTDINEPLRDVTIGINGTFNKATTETLTCILYLLIPSRFEVSGNRAVTLVL